MDYMSCGVEVKTSTYIGQYDMRTITKTFPKRERCNMNNSMIGKHDVLFWNVDTICLVALRLPISGHRKVGDAAGA